MDKRIREGIEACRPGSDDFRSPDMADVTRALECDAEARLIQRRVAEWDVAISRSIEDVSVPPELAQRILDRLAAAAQPQEAAPGRLAASIATAAQVEASPGHLHASPVARRATWSRRRWVGGSAAALAAVVLVVIAANWLRQGSDLPVEMLADRWQELLKHEWEPIAQAPRDFMPPEAVRVAPARWQWIDRRSLTPVAAFELVHPDPKAGKAVLYVARSKSAAPAAPPVTPQSTTGGKAVGYWRSGDYVYVLVVPNERSYRAFVRSSATPLA